MRRQPRGPMWKRRIVGSGFEAPDQLLANPANGWKIHPAEQQDELEKLLEEVGWVQSVIVNKVTGHLVDGHLRVQLALRREEEEVPVTYVELSPAEEKLLVAVMDPIAGMIARDREALDELVQDIVRELPTSEVDLAAILKTERKRSKGLTVHECLCCKDRCEPGCGCYRETGD